MPRPKRARRAPTQTAKHTARSPTPEGEASDGNVPKQAQSQERGRRRTTRSTGSRLSAADEQAIRAAAQRRDAALDRLANEDPTTSGNTLDDGESGSSVELGRRVMATPAQRRDTTGLDLADDVFGDFDDSFEDGDVPRGVQSTDTSSLNLSTFKRRSRQSSIIGRNDPPIRPSSRGGNTPSISSTLHFGTFRRRAREPSILGTARKPRPDETGTGQEDNSESEEEFLPEAESTPMNNRRRTQPAPNVEDKPEDERESSAEAEENPKSRKRKSEDALLSSDRPEKMSRVEADDMEDADEPDEVPDSDSDSSSLSSLSSPLGPSPILPERPVTPVNLDEILAPPASSDSEGGADIWPDIHTLAKRRRRPSVVTPIRADHMSDMSSPPSLTHSPNFTESKAPKTRGRAATRQQPSPKVTTADLTSMLPKRRYKKARDDPFGLESEDEHDTTEMPQGEDELSYVDSRAARRRQGSRPRSRGISARPGSRAGRAAHSVLKPRQTAASARPAAKSTRTYAPRSSDKENEGEDEQGDDEENEVSRFEPLPDDTFDTGDDQSSSTPSADELKKATKKFNEVDKWELEYEEVTQSSSPQGAR
ncbi:RNA helicase [Neonectria magnoliae]|uniref:RNA helicase n=1 Tax=Neonectria magnoliae TaxID=2732573 RepID=A0ABR1HNZ2_9HYPO